MRDGSDSRGASANPVVRSMRVWLRGRAVDYGGQDMYVRAVSSINNMIISSMVYAMLNLGWYTQYIVYNKSTNSFELIDYIDKIPPHGRVMVQIIQPQKDGFEEYGHVKLLKIKKFCKENNMEMPEIKFLTGYPDVCENSAFICDIIANR